MQKTLLASALLLAFSANAEDNIETIEVTADYQTQNLQTLPASVSVVDKQSIEDRQARHLQDVLNLAANLNFTAGASRGRFVQIRGIGERSQYAEPINPSVGLLVDNIDMSGMGGAATLFDVAQVEVLRGPQSSNIGTASLAGVIKITTTEAGADAPNLFSASVATQNSWTLGLAQGGELTDKLAYRVALQQNSSDGFIHNTYLNRDDTQNIDEFTGRLKLKYQASDDLTLRLNLQKFDINNGYDAFSLENDGNTRSDEPGFDNQDTTAITLQADWQQSWGTLQAITTFSNTDLEYGYDEDWTYVGFHPDEYSSTDAFYRQRDNRSVDLRAMSATGGEHGWVVGVHFSDGDEDLQHYYTYDDDFFSAYAPQNVAIYGQYQQALADKLQLTGALRIDRYSLSYSDSNGFVQDNDDTMVGGKLVLDYRIDDTMVYAGIYRGYKAGGFNPDASVSDAARIFRPEYTWNYEAGVKGSYADDAGFYRLAVFTMRRQDTQVSDYDLQYREDGSAKFVDIIGNASNGKNSGVELETGMQVTDALYLNASVGYLDATFGDYTTADDNYVAERTQAQAPKLSYHLAGRYHFSDSWSLYLDVDGKSPFYFSDGHDQKSSSVALVNANLNWQSDNLSLSLWASNLLDKTYYTRGFYFNNDPREGYGYVGEGLPYNNKAYYQLGNGRQVGVTLDYRF